MNFATAAPVSTNASSLSREACTSLLARSCFGHLAFANRTEPQILPVRLVVSEGWIYFRADRVLARAIRHNAWVAVTVSERIDATHVASVIANGACYATDRTGSWKDDAAALRGIVKLRDRVPSSVTGRRRMERTQTIFRVHLEDVRGTITVVPCDQGP
jgi:nitroimidazol reductase NimA-like FMN-containing flavoprotein (pyridoxamine 5'-phosphate oxidase superfamily)